MEKAKLAALQSQIELYNNFIAKHDKQKTKTQSAVLNHGSSTSSTLCNAHGKVPTQTNSKLTQSSIVNQPVNFKFLNRNLTADMSHKNFHNKTFIRSKMISPAAKTSFINHNKLSVKPVAIKSSMSWSSTHKCINNNKKSVVLCKKMNTCAGNPLDISAVPKLQNLGCNLKSNTSTPCLNVKLNATLKHVENVQNLQPITKTPLKKENSKSHPATLCKEITAMIEQLKNASNTLSSKNPKCVKPSINLEKRKLCTKLVNSSKLASGHVAKNVVPSVLSPKRSLSVSVPKLSTPKLETTRCNEHENAFKIACSLKATKTANSPLGCIPKNPKSIPPQSIISKQNLKNMNITASKLLERTTESVPETCMKPLRRPEKVQIIAAPKTPVSVKRKAIAAKLIPSGSRKADGLSLIMRTSAVQENLKTAYESQLVLQRKGALKPFRTKTKLLISKYKVVNKNYSASNLKGNISESPLQKSFKRATPIFSRKRKSISECVQKSKKSKMANNSPFFKANPMTPIGQYSNKLHLRTPAKKNFKPSIPLKRPKVYSLNSRSKSEFKAIYKTPSKSWTRVSKGLKAGSNKLFNFSTDVDLLMELAAEKNSNISTPKPRDRSVLLKRLYKSKNTIINKNVSSVRVKTAKMIKSKYFASNRRYSGHKQAKSRNFSNFKPFQDGHKSFPAKFHSTSFYNHRIRRNLSKHKISNYASSSYFPRNVKKIQYPQNRLDFGTFKSYKRISGSRAVFSKTYNVKKLSTPISKSLASRVLQHSINRVLTASVKKKMSKVNTYCMFYNRFGRCNKGTKCTYIHDPSKIAICTRFLRGTCKVENCLFSHEICPGKMAICSFFLSGSCTKANCPYRHEMLSPGTELCKAFVKGYCPDGKQCKKAHVLVCPEYVKGFCSKGDACAFPHPPPKEKKIIEKTAEKCENLDNDDILMERVSRYFQPTSGQDLASSDLVVPKRRNLPEQPSFISLSMDDCES